MTGNDTSAGETEKSAVIGEVDASHLSLTLRAAGPATYKRRLEDSEYVDSVAIHQDVVVTISRVLRGPSEFRECIDLGHHNKPIVDQESIIDQLLTGRCDRYSRSDPLSDWSVTIEGTATDWKQFALALATDEDSEWDSSEVATATAEGAVWILRTLIDAEVADTGASLAVLELIDEHDLDIDCAPFVDRIRDESTGDS